MLPAVRTTMTALTAAVAIALAPAAPAHAWGDKEQGFVAGVATFLLLNEIAKDAKRRRAPAYQAPDPIYAPGNPGPVYGVSPAKSAFMEYSPNARRAIQSRLKSYGYYYGAVDGVWGQGTARAIAAYARDVGYGNDIGTRNGAVQLYNALLA
jgi:hypothetical protein